MLRQPPTPLSDGEARPPEPEPVPTGERAGGVPSPRRRSLTITQLLVLVVVAALVGSGAALIVARATGWGSQTVIQRSVGSTSAIGTPVDTQRILAKALPSVVSISATSTGSSPYFGPGYGSATVTAEGTGVVVSRDGEIITNDHVVNGATSITVTLNGSSEPLPATVLGASVDNDLALLKIDSPVNLVPATFGDSTKALVGDEVLAVGYALALSGGPSVTDGIISAVGREVSTESSTGATVTLTGMLQTDAAISSGNSGGPLVDTHARVIGINTVVATSSSSTTAQNIGFAIPSRTVESLLPQLRAG